MITPPTDNLYKFVSIFGLIIFLFSIYYPYQKAHDLTFNVYELESEVEYIKFKNKHLKGRVKIIEKRLEKEENLEKAQEIRDDFYKHEIELKKLLVKASENINKAELLLFEVKAYMWLGIIGNIFGVLLMWFGFRRWYIYIQKPNDEQIKKTNYEKNES